MAKKTASLPTDHIIPLNINGLEGRMLYLPTPKSKRQILFVYGQHASLERWWGLILGLNAYGSVTAPDLPGFGGMDSFYKIKQSATLDNYADYLAAFIKLRYKQRHLTIIGVGFGLAVATRLLQRYSSLTEQVDCLVSIGGFAHGSDFLLTDWQRIWRRLISAVGSRRWPALAFRYFMLGMLQRTMFNNQGSQPEAVQLTAAELVAQQDYEANLWRLNDVRTHMRVTQECLRLNNCLQPVALPVYHLALESTFDNHAVEQHLRIIFKDFRLLGTAPATTAITGALTDLRSATPWLPPKLRRVLRQQ